MPYRRSDPHQASADQYGGVSWQQKIIVTSEGDLLNPKRIVVLAVLLLSVAPLLHADALDDLARDFWGWRTSEQPVSTDDIPRVERPPDWVPQWAPAAVAAYQKQLEEFEGRWKKMDASTWPVARQVDYRLMGSALARVRWELDINKSWRRDPAFYVDQTAGAYFHMLLPPPPFDAARSRQIVAILASIPATVDYAKQNLSEPAAPFAHLAINDLENIRSRMLKSVGALKPLLDSGASRNIDTNAERAVAALEAYRDWLTEKLPSMAKESAVGRDGYIFFLKNVALLPYTPEQLQAMGRQEWARSVASQTYEEHHNLGVPELVIFKNEAEQIARGQKDELAVRRFLEEKDILTVPAWVEHYTFKPMPPYMAPLEGAGEADDFTGPSRLNEDCTRYIDPPSPKLGYFALATAKDPRPDMVHEGVPGHYFQLALSWKHPDPIRRHYYDSGANEGLGFYAEEMMMTAGLFDDSPRTREIIWNFMRLRALRVEVDVRLALGEFTLDQGAAYLEKTVPMDPRTAHAEVALFASTPGQAISYEIGKLQIYKFLADARSQKGAAFSLRTFHDYLWLNGNVPIALQCWEYLGAKDELDAVDRLH
jgi:uncharacterized protein (DUF885 family)